jgi:hypothetical protein
MDLLKNSFKEGFIPDPYPDVRAMCKEATGNVPVDRAKDMLIQQLKGQRPLNEVAIVRELCEGHPDGCGKIDWRRHGEELNVIQDKYASKNNQERNWDKWPKKDQNSYFAETEQVWKKEREEDTESKRKFFEKKKRMFRNKKVYLFEFSDNGAFGCTMEHGEVFETMGLPVIRVSKH